MCESVANANTYRTFSLAGCGFLAFIYIRDPRVEGNFPLCPWLCATGTHCPGCGTMRALHQLMHFEILSAISYNALTVFLVPVLALALINKIIPISIFSRLDITLASTKTLYFLAFSVGLFWVLRNIPFEPFAWLAPPGWIEAA